MASADTLIWYGSILLLPLNLRGGLDTIKNSIADFGVVDMNPFESCHLLL